MIDQIIQFFFNALFFISPLIMTKSTSELFEFNKMLFIYASTVLITFFWFLKMITTKKIILKKTILDIPILIFFLFQLISTFLSIDRHVSFFGYYGRFNGGLVSIICYITLYYAFVSNIINVEKILKTIAASSLFVILWAIPGHFGHDLTCLLFTGQFNNSCWDNTTLAFRPELRAFSTLGQPNWLGAYLAVVFFIGIYFLLKNQISNIKDQKYISNIKNYVWPIYLFLNFSMILFSRSRSAIGAVIVGLILFVGYYSLFIKTNFKKILFILLFVTLFPIILFKTGEGKIDKYLSISNIQIKNQKENSVIVSPSSRIDNLASNKVTESFDIRKIVWEGAWKLALKYPFFGTGVETFAYSYNFVRPAAHNLTSEWDYVYNKAHNEYFNYLATTGFIGLTSYFLLIFFFIFYALKISNLKFLIFNQFQNFKYKFFKNSKSDIENSLKIKKLKLKIEEDHLDKNILTITLTIAYITVLITNFFGFSTTTIQLFFYLIPAFIIVLHSSPSDNNDQSLNNLTIVQKISIFLLLLSTIYLLSSVVIYYMADVNYSYGTKYAKIDDQQRAAGYFEQSIKLRKEPVYEDRFSSTLSYLSALASLQNQKDLSTQIASMSDSYNRELIQAFPKNVFYWKTRAKNMFYFYQKTGKENEILQGIRALKKAQELSPTDPKISYSLALYYSTLSDITKDNQKQLNWKNLSLEEIDKTIKLKSNYREAYLFQGQLLKKYGQLNEARKVFEYILKNFNENDTDAIRELQSL